MEAVRRCGAHKIVVDGSIVLCQAVVEIMGDRVVNYYEFRGELPMTEWLGGVIEVKTDNDGVCRAFHEERPLTQIE